MMRRGAVALGLLIVAHAHPSRADANTCIGEHEAGLASKRNGALLEAAARFQACARSECPGAIRDECTAQVLAITRAMPTIVLAAESPRGEDLTEVTVRIDGVIKARQLDGRPVAIDPGKHRIVFEVPSYGRVERQVVAREGETNRRVLAQFRATPPPVTEKDRPLPERKAPTLGYVLVAVGGAALATFTGFAIAGKSKESELDKCAPRCNPSEVRVMQRRYLIADIALGVGVLSLGGAAATFLSVPAGPDRQAHGVSFSGRF